MESNNLECSGRGCPVFSCFILFFGRSINAMKNHVVEVEVEVQRSKCTSDRGQSVHRNNDAMWICGFVDFGAKSSSGAILIKENQFPVFYIFRCICIV